MGLGKWGVNPNFQFATEERSISHNVKNTYWPFRDIAELEELCLIN